MIPLWIQYSSGLLPVINSTVTRACWGNMIPTGQHRLTSDTEGLCAFSWASHFASLSFSCFTMTWSEGFKPLL